MRKSNELQIGKAGEYIVCADIIMKGMIAFPSEQGLPYDVLIDTGDDLLRCQVKTTSGPRIVPQRATTSKAYVFNIKRHGKGNKVRYTEKEVDLFAFVCLDTMMVGYMLPSKTAETINIRVDSLRGTHYDEKGLVDYEVVQKLKAEGKGRTEISKQTGMSYSTVARYYLDSHKPFLSKAPYFSDFKRNREWFLNVKRETAQMTLGV